MAYNFHFDPVEFLKELPLDNLVQIHLAGGYFADGVMIDSHSEPVDEGSWTLLETLVRLTTVKASILEHDTNFPEAIGGLLDQVGRAKRIIVDNAMPSGGVACETLHPGQVSAD